MSDDDRLKRLLSRVVPDSADLATKAVLEAAMREAMDVTHEVGTEAETDRAVFTTLRDAIWTAARTLGPPWCERRNCAEAAYAVSLPTCLGHHNAPIGIQPVPRDPEYSCGNPDCGGCYHSAHGGCEP